VKCHNLSKRDVKLILKVLSDLEPLRGSSNKKTLYSTSSCVNWAFFGTRVLKWPTRAKKGPIYAQTRQTNYYFILNMNTIYNNCFIQDLFDICFKLFIFSIKRYTTCVNISAASVQGWKEGDLNSYLRYKCKKYPLLYERV
jgi:hypothetical protein